MRKINEPQMTLGQKPIDKIVIDMKSRDEIPQLLLGIQRIYSNKEIRNKVEIVLQEMLPDGVDSKNGRPGMNLWNIFIIGSIRLNCNYDYDHLHDIVNNHKTIRQFLGHGLFDNEKKYSLQSLKDNVKLLTPEILEKINTIVVNEGHDLMCEEDCVLKGRCDSFVLETNVHFPTDSNLLFDAIRKIIQTLAVICEIVGINSWEQHKFYLRSFKKLFKKVSNMKRSNSKNTETRKKRDELIKKTYKSLIEDALFYVNKAIATIDNLPSNNQVYFAKIEEAKRYIAHALRQIDQIERRVINEETIPHKEKVFSIFETHTEWISKGKAGVPQELGLRVCILEDNFGFILHNRVMENETDDKIAVTMVDDTQAKFPNLRICSFDKGFYTPENKKNLKTKLDMLVMPKKGRLNKEEIMEESEEAFVQNRRKHSAVESGINALENHGLNRCPDHGIDGFKRYVALSVVARNLQKLGSYIQKLELEKIRRQQLIKKAA